MNNIVIMSTQRSGSTMLVDDMTRTGVLGRPNEYLLPFFNGSSNSFLEKNDFTLNVIKKNTYRDVFSIKVMAKQVEWLEQQITKQNISTVNGFCDYFDKSTVYLRLIRNDKVSQAISRIVARKTKIYHLIGKNSGLSVGNSIQLETELPTLNVETDYNFEQIDAEISSINLEEKYWNQYIDENNLIIKTFIYEDIVDDLEYVKEICNLLGVSTDFSLTPRKIKKIGGKLNKEWKMRYEIEK